MAELLVSLFHCYTRTLQLIIFLTILLLVAKGVYCSEARQDVLKKKVVILYSYREGWWAVEDERKGIRAGLATMGFIAGKNIEVVNLYMNTKTVNKTPDQREETAQSLVSRIFEEDPDILFIMDDDALKHVGAKLLDTKYPIVFGGINLVVTDPDYGWRSGSERIALADSMKKPGHNITGVLERIAIRAGFNVLHQILPGAETALFLSDNSSLSRQLLRAAGSNVFNDLPLKIEKLFFTDSYEEMQRVVLQYQEKVDCIIMFLPWTFEDVNGQHIPQEQVVSWLLKNNQRPGIAYLDILAEEGFLCGVVVDMVQQGIHAGIIGGRILRGAQPSSIPIIDPVANRIMINMARANQLDIDVPFEVIKNTDIIFKSMSAFPEYSSKAQ